MSVLFDEERSYAPVRAVSPQRGIIGLVQRWGIARSDEEAQRVLLIVAGIAFSITLWLLFREFNGNPQPSQTPDQLRAQNGYAGPLPGIDR